MSVRFATLYILAVGLLASPGIAQGKWVLVDVVHSYADSRVDAGLYGEAIAIAGPGSVMEARVDGSLDVVFGWADYAAGFGGSTGYTFQWQPDPGEPPAPTEDLVVDFSGYADAFARAIASAGGSSAAAEARGIATTPVGLADIPAVATATGPYGYAVANPALSSFVATGTFSVPSGSCTLATSTYVYGSVEGFGVGPKADCNAQAQSQKT